MKSQRKRKKKTNRTRVGMFAITFVVLVLCAVLSFQIKGLLDRKEILSEKKAELEEVLETENDRTEDLEEERVYVQTNEYIEKIAKNRGYIYPNEIIFKPVTE